MLTGIFIIAACCLVVAVILFLEPEVGDGKKTLKVRFSNISKIYVGTRVVYAGRPVGEVVSITQNPHAREEKTDNLGRLYFYDLTLKVDSTVDVYHSDLICIQTAGLLGDKSIAIVPRATQKGQTPLLVNNDILYADSLDPLENAFNEMSTISQHVQNTLNELNLWMHNFGDDTGKTIQNFGSSMNKIEHVISKLDKGQFFETTASTLKNLDSVTHKLAQGEGTLGKILEKDNVFYKLDGLLSKADTLMDDINHYGLLFHNNRGWQRLRATRMNQIASAKSPKAISKVLENEIHEINAALSRLSTLASSIDNDKNDKQMFSQAYLELQDRAKALLENLRILNQNVIGK